MSMRVRRILKGFRQLFAIQVNSNTCTVLACEETFATVRSKAAMDLTCEECPVKQQQFTVSPLGVVSALRDYWLPIWQRDTEDMVPQLMNFMPSGRISLDSR